LVAREAARSVRRQRAFLLRRGERFELREPDVGRLELDRVLERVPEVTAICDIAHRSAEDSST